jgi:hypothetical protein
MTEQRDPFEDRLAEQLTDLAETPLAYRTVNEEIADVAITAKTPTSWPATVLTAAALVAVLVTAAVVGQRPGDSASAPSLTPPPLTPAPATTSPATPTPTELELAYTCGGDHPFSPTIFNEPATDLRSSPAGTALAEFLEAGGEVEPGMFSPEGWRLAGEDASSATFVAPRQGEFPYAYARLENENGAWRLAGGGDCRPQISLRNAGGATWVLARGEHVDASSTSFVADVTEQVCTGGSSSEGRVREPVIIYEPDRVVVIFTVDPLPEGIYGCPSNPVTPVRVKLSEPLGDRQLLDGGEFPWRDATKREPWQR